MHSTKSANAKHCILCIHQLIPICNLVDSGVGQHKELQKPEAMQHPKAGNTKETHKKHEPSHFRSSLQTNTVQREMEHTPCRLQSLVLG